MNVDALTSNLTVWKEATKVSRQNGSLKSLTGNTFTAIEGVDRLGSGVDF